MTVVFHGKTMKQLPILPFTRSGGPQNTSTYSEVVALEMEAIKQRSSAGTW